MPKQKQIIVWEAFARLIDEENLEFEEINEMQSNNCNFIGKIILFYMFFLFYV